MRIGEMNPQNILGKAYIEHVIFKELKYYSNFYSSLSFLVMNHVSKGLTALLNLDTYTYSSIKGTIDSISDILSKGRINDAYALLRKYYDSTIINVYTNLYLANNYCMDNLVVEKIDNWRKGVETLPEYRIISKYIKDSPQLSQLNNLLAIDSRYKKIRNRCNDNTHCNFYKNVLLNDNHIYNPNRVKWLTIFSQDLEALFIQHFAYIFTLNSHYMMSTDYMDCLDMGVEPEENSQDWVAPFIQEAFDKVIKTERADIAKWLKDNTCMNLL